MDECSEDEHDHLPAMPQNDVLVATLISEANLIPRIHLVKHLARRTAYIGRVGGNDEMKMERQAKAEDLKGLSECQQC